MAGLSCWATAHGVAAIKTNAYWRALRSVVKVSTTVIIYQQTPVVYDCGFASTAVVI
jgi:hypothetical protein